jgi:uncharacterized protein involved in exopolysaccharide biosynthesis
VSSAASETQDPGGADLQAVWRHLWINRAWIAGSVVLFAALFTIAALIMPRTYRATTVLVSAGAERNSLSSSLNSALGSLGGLASIAGVNVGTSDAATEEALAVLRSRQFTEAFIASNHLLPELYPRQWDASTGQWKDAADAPTTARAFRYFDRKVREVTQDRKTGLITVQIDWRDRNEAAVWANAMVQRLNEEMRSRAIAKADASLAYLQGELQKTVDIGTRDAINRLIEAQIRQRMLANVTEEFAFRVVDKALPPDADDPQSPKKAQWIVGGIVVGLLVGVMAALSRKRVS